MTNVLGSWSVKKASKVSAVSSKISGPSCTSASRGDAGEGSVEGTMPRGRSMGLDGRSLAGELGLVPMDRTEQGGCIMRLSAHCVDAVATRGDGQVEGFRLGDASARDFDACASIMHSLLMGFCGGPNQILCVVSFSHFRFEIRHRR